MNASRLLLIPTVIATLACAASFARAQGSQATVFTNLTNVEVKQLSNGVRIAFDFDGTFNLRVQPEKEGWLTFLNDYTWPPAFNRVRVIRFQFTNARTQAGAFFDVSRYPVSHVELAIPPGAPEGVGLDVAIVLAQPAMFRELDTSNDGWCCWDSTPPSFDIRDTQTRRQLIVTVLSDRLAEQPEARRTEQEAAAFPGDLSVENQGGILKVRALNTPLRSFAQALSEATGVPFTVDDAVQRFIHLSLPTASLDETLEDLRRTYDLAISPLASGYWITSGSPDSGTRYSGLSTGHIPLQYIQALDAVDLFPDFMRRYLQPDEGTNGLVVTGTSALVDKVRRDAAAIDVPPPQIEVELIAAEISDARDASDDLTLDTHQRHEGYHLQPGTGALWIESARSDAVDWTATWNALASSERVRIVARSKVRVVNGEKATLFAGTDKLIPIQIASDYGPDVEISDVNSGARLEVTPWTGGNGDITMHLKPSSDTIVSLDQGLPTVDTRSAETTVRAHDGDTILIGGLGERSRYETHRKIPILGDIPLIGRLFRWKQRSQLKDDLVFFVTPRIVHPHPLPLSP